MAAVGKLYKYVFVIEWAIFSSIFEYCSFVRIDSFVRIEKIRNPIIIQYLRKDTHSMFPADQNTRLPGYLLHHRWQHVDAISHLGPIQSYWHPFVSFHQYISCVAGEDEPHFHPIDESVLYIHFGAFYFLFLQSLVTIFTSSSFLSSFLPWGERVFSTLLTHFFVS